MRRIVLPSSRVLLAAAIAAYAAGFAALSVLRHEAYVTGRFDLGNMVQAVWSTAHGRPLQMTDLHGDQISRLAAHVDPILEQGYRGVDYDRLLVGSPETVVGRLRHYKSMGFEHVMVRHITGDHDAMIRSFELLGDVVAAVA